MTDKNQAAKAFADICLQRKEFNFDRLSLELGFIRGFETATRGAAEIEKIRKTAGITAGSDGNDMQEILATGVRDLHLPVRVLNRLNYNVEIGA